MADEQVFMQEGSVLVSSSRIEISGQTFATRNIGSVKVVAPGVSKLAILCVILGILFLLGPVNGFGGFIALLVTLYGLYWAWTTSRTRRLILIAGGGEVMALETTNPKLIETLRSSIAQAISVR